MRSRAAADQFGAACGEIFVAMVQGAVYGAVNAVDRHGQPYLVMRSFPKASADADSTAFHVLDALVPAQHVTLLAASCGRW